MEILVSLFAICIFGICYLIACALKFAVVYLICKNPQLSLGKIKAIADMISKDININLPY